MSFCTQTSGLILWVASALALGSGEPLLAHNGAVAIAVPVSGIAIDGDLSDWPEDLRRYPIAPWVERPRCSAMSGG